MRPPSILFMLLCLVLPASPAAAKEKKQAKQEQSMDPQAVMDTYTKLATPGEPHKRMASLAGKLEHHDQGLDGSRQASHGIHRLLRADDAVGRALPANGMYRRHDGTVVHRYRSERI